MGLLLEAGNGIVRENRLFQVPDVILRRKMGL
jgi:hypothetical protein